MTGAVISLYAPARLIPQVGEGFRALLRMRKGVREVRRFMDTLEQSLRALRATVTAPALQGLEDRVWDRVHATRISAALERQWRAAQMLAASFALVTGIAFGGAEATALLRAQQSAPSLTTPALAPSELLEGHG